MVSQKKQVKGKIRSSNYFKPYEITVGEGTHKRTIPSNLRCMMKLVKVLNTDARPVSLTNWTTTVYLAVYQPVPHGVTKINKCHRVPIKSLDQ